MTTRRGFLATILATAAAPALVRAESLMPIYVPPPPRLLTLWGDLLHDDTDAIQAIADGKPVLFNGAEVRQLPPSGYRLDGRVVLPDTGGFAAMGCGFHRMLPSRRGAMFLAPPVGETTIQFAGCYFSGAGIDYSRGAISYAGWRPHERDIA